NTHAPSIDHTERLIPDLPKWYRGSGTARLLEPNQGAPRLDIPTEPLGWSPAFLAALCAARPAMRSDETSTEFAFRPHSGPKRLTCRAPAGTAAVSGPVQLLRGAGEPH